eukprot:gene3592-biopygen3497
MAQVLKDKVGLDGRAASDMAEDCARDWPDPRVAKLAAAAAEGGTPLDSRTIQQIEQLVASQKQTQEQLVKSQKQTQEQLGTLQKQILEGRQAFQATSSESKQIQKAVEASLATFRAEQSRTKDETLESVLQKIRSEDVKRLEKTILDLRKEMTRLQIGERDLDRVKHENGVLRTKLTATELKLERQFKESGLLRQLLERVWFAEDSQGRDGLRRMESADRLRMSNTLGLLELGGSEECGRRELTRKFSAPPCNIDNEWEMMEGAKWVSAIIDPEAGIRGFSVQPGRASDAEPPALVETPDHNRRRKSGARDSENQQSSMISRATGLAVRLYESFSPAPKKSRADENDGPPKSEDSDREMDDSRDRDRDDSREGSDPSPRPLAREKWKIGQLVLAKEERKGDFADAEIINIDNKLGVQVKWAESGGEKWLRKNMWEDRLKESCRIEGSSAAKQRV